MGNSMLIVASGWRSAFNRKREGNPGAGEGLVGGTRFRFTDQIDTERSTGKGKNSSTQQIKSL